MSQALGILLIDQNINDEDPVYLHAKCIKVAPHREPLCNIQASLKELLSEKLNGAGRQNLAEKTVAKQSITYKELKSLVHQINKPQTVQTPPDNRYQDQDQDQDQDQEAWSEPTLQPTTKTTTLPKNNPNNDSLECQGARPKEETIQKSKINSDNTSLASSHGARPKTHNIEIDEDFDIKNSYDFDRYFALCCQKIVEAFEKKAAIVFEYINNPKDKKKLSKAKRALNRGPWHPDQYFDLLEKAYEADKLDFFSKRLNFFIENSYFKTGYPPRENNTGKHYAVIPHKLIGFGSNYNYVLADNVTPSEAIDGYKTNFCLINQETILQLSSLEASRRYFGESLFNSYYSTVAPNSDPLSMLPFITSYNIKSRCRVMIFLDLVIPAETLAVGFIYSFSNHSHYIKRNFNGDYRSLYGLCCEITPQPRFITLCSSKKLTIDEIQDKLVELYNKKPCNERSMKPTDWKTFLIFSKQEKPSLNIKTITKESLIEDDSGYMEFSLQNNFKLMTNMKDFYANKLQQNATKIKIKKDKELEQQDRNKATFELYKTENESARNKHYCTEEKTTTKKQPTSEPESNPINILKNHIKDANTAYRHYKKEDTSNNAIIAKEKLCKLKIFFNNLKTDNINIDIKTQRHYDDIVKNIDAIPDLVNPRFP